MCKSGCGAPSALTETMPIAARRETSALPVPPSRARRPLTVPEPAATLQLSPQQALRIVDHTGRALLDIVPGEAGPTLRLATADAALDVDGQLRVSADSIELLARDGDLRMLAKDDIVARGEKIRLN